MTTINDIFSTFGSEYMERFGDDMPLEHRKTINAMLQCRTKDAGYVYCECEQCGRPHIVCRSRGNRHCPACQHHKSQ